MDDQINRVEAVLFSSGRKIPLEDLKKICKIKVDDDILKCIDALKERYNDKTSLMLVEENKAWKMTVREKYLQYIKKIVTDTELTKTVMETLAVIAWKNPALQSDVIKIRTNKAYDHINELQDSGFIESSKYGRTKLLKLTKKFYDYFDLESDKDIKNIFGDVKHPKMPQTKVIDYDEIKEQTLDSNLENNNIEINQKNKVQIVNINEDVDQNNNNEENDLNNYSVEIYDKDNAVESQLKGSMIFINEEKPKIEIFNDDNIDEKNDLNQPKTIILDESNEFEKKEDDVVNDNIINDDASEVVDEMIKDEKINDDMVNDNIDEKKK